MSELSAVRPHLLRRLDDRRVVFWHDPQGQYHTELDSLDLPGVTTLRVANNEFAIKNRLLHDQPADKFLVYRPGQVPVGVGNWLLDLELAYGVFTADRSSLVAQDLGLTAEGIEQVVQEHDEFFNAGKRVQSLKKRLNPDDDAVRLRAKMSAVVLGLNQEEHSLLEITRTLLIENSEDRCAKYDALVGYGLDGFYWRGVASIYGYASPQPGLGDFILWIFRQAIGGFQSDGPGGLQNIQLDFASLRNDRRSQKALAILAQRASQDLEYRATIEDASFRDLIDVDLFEEIDQKIIKDLARAVTDQTVTAREVADVVRARQDTVWIDSYSQFYQAIGAAAELLSAIGSMDFATSSFDEALDRYRNEWFRVDQLYRQFTFARRGCEGSDLLDGLRQQVEKRYTNKFVYELGNAWQQRIDEAGQWTSIVMQPQAAFYSEYIEPILQDGKKAVVIISDALRYEVAEELGSRIRREDRFDAHLDAVLGVLPSYTQLGMAALLPHRTLRYSRDGKVVLVDDQPTNGTVARGKILESVGGTAVRAEQFRGMSPESRRELFKANRVLYVYHDTIDKTGDDLLSEQSVFEAAEAALREVVDLVKKAANANATNIFVTADHGFLFQDEALPEQFYLSEMPQGDNILVTNRRYVLGQGLKEADAFTTYSALELKLAGELEVQIPKSIHRLKLAGGGSRFVHGGATLQEVVVPVLAINKKRKSDTRLVN
ncbi:MAG: BREX-1 system phosphatase PglZ type A, partial [Acidimicrobiia bacterium]|nr:BREX-1 system phosphatase PglZ type A [Acidimicrobiia bacterium]